jgi:predicted XRE-type DNA-binding protein
MAQVELRITLPADVAALLGATAEDAARRARLAAILHLLRDGAISQARAAMLLGMTRHDILDLMAQYDIPSGAQTLAEYRRDIEREARLLGNRKS